MRYAWCVKRSPLLDLFDASLVGREREAGLELGPPGGPIETLTFGEIEARSRRMAHVLASRGLRAGDRLVVQLPNGLEFLDLFLACLRLGVIFVPVNVLYREREVGHIVGDAEPVAVVTTPDLAGLVPAGTPVWDVDEPAARHPEERRPRRATRDPPRLRIPRDPSSRSPSG